VPCGGPADDFPRLWIQGRIQRQRSVAVVFETGFSARPGESGKRRSSRSKA
jgi:hypothetical protein